MRPAPTGHLELDEAALRLLKAHGWPGNVRELHNTLERTVMFSDGPRIDARALARFLGEGERPGFNAGGSRRNGKRRVRDGAGRWFHEL